MEEYSRGSERFSFHADPCIVILKRSVKLSLVSVRVKHLLTILRVNKHLLGKLCTSVLSYDVTFIVAIFLIEDQL